LFRPTDCTTINYLNVLIINDVMKNTTKARLLTSLLLLPLYYRIWSRGIQCIKEVVIRTPALCMYILYSTLQSHLCRITQRPWRFAANQTGSCRVRRLR
jgi:hypothetical protein